MLRASIEGIKARGKSDLGDKTLLDALVPAVDAIEQRASAEAPGGRGRCGRRRSRARGRRPRPPARWSPSAAAPAYTGERSIGTLDAGAVAVAVMFEALAEQWREPPGVRLKRQKRPTETVTDDNQWRPP